MESNYQPQLVNAGFLPSTVSPSTSCGIHHYTISNSSARLEVSWCPGFATHRQERPCNRNAQVSYSADEMEGCLSIRGIPVVELAIPNFSIFNQVPKRFQRTFFGWVNNHMKDVCTKECSANATLSPRLSDLSDGHCNDLSEKWGQSIKSVWKV